MNLAELGTGHNRSDSNYRNSSPLRHKQTPAGLTSGAYELSVSPLPHTKSSNYSHILNTHQDRVKDSCDKLANALGMQ